MKLSYSSTAVGHSSAHGVIGPRLVPGPTTFGRLLGPLTDAFRSRVFQRAIK